jgi:hypothetical protein
MKTTAQYTYTVLRYVHDVMTGEFINVGLVMHVSGQEKILARALAGSSRVKCIFPDLDQDAFASSMRAAQRALSKPFHSAQNAMSFASDVIPKDNSSLQWSPEGSGLSDDVTQAFERLYDRLVTRYEKQDQKPTIDVKETTRQFSFASTLEAFEAFASASGPEETAFELTTQQPLPPSAGVLTEALLGVANSSVGTFNTLSEAWQALTSESVPRAEDFWLYPNFQNTDYITARTGITSGSSSSSGSPYNAAANTISLTTQSNAVVGIMVYPTINPSRPWQQGVSFQKRQHSGPGLDTVVRLAAENRRLKEILHVSISGGQQPTISVLPGLADNQQGS